jgi:hypothetical protein
VCFCLNKVVYKVLVRKEKIAIVFLFVQCPVVSLLFLPLFYPGQTKFYLWQVRKSTHLVLKLQVVLRHSTVTLQSKLKIPPYKVEIWNFPFASKIIGCTWIRNMVLTYSWHNDIFWKMMTSDKWLSNKNLWIRFQSFRI